MMYARLRYDPMCVQELQEDLEKQESSVRRFGAVTHQLLKESHPSLSDSLNNSLQDVNARSPSPADIRFI